MGSRLFLLMSLTLLRSMIGTDSKGTCIELDTGDQEGPTTTSQLSIACLGYAT